MKTSIITLTATFALISGLLAEPASNADLKKLTDIEVNHATVTKVLESQKGKSTIETLQAPMIIKSLDEAMKHLNREALENIAENVDFEAQELLLFIWKGSGKDQLTARVLESLPTQVKFEYAAGRTKDLQTHVSAFAKPIDAKWSVSRKHLIIHCGVGGGELRPDGLRDNRIQIHPVKPGAPKIEIEGQEIDPKLLKQLEGIQLNGIPLNELQGNGIQLKIQRVDPVERPKAEEPAK